METLARHLLPLPSRLWDYLLECAGGFAAVSTGESRYVAGPATIGQQQVCNVAFLSVEDLARDNDRPLHVVGHLVDHYLGCQGAADGVWLSEGGGLTSDWRQAGNRLQRLFALGYGVDEKALSSTRDYFAQSLAIYCRDRRRLNVADPQVYRWLRSTLWNSAFWQIPERQEENVCTHRV